MYAIPYILVSISSVISVLSCIFMIYLYHHYPRISRLDGSKHIYILQTLDLILSLFVIIPTPVYPNSTLCHTQGFGIYSFTISGVWWTGFISIELFVAFYARRKLYCVSMNTILVFCIGIGLIVGGLPFTFNGFSQTGEWCAVVTTKYMTTAELACNYGIVYAIISIVMCWNVFIYTIVIRKYKEIEFERPSDCF